MQLILFSARPRKIIYATPNLIRSNVASVCGYSVDGRLHKFLRDATVFSRCRIDHEGSFTREANEALRHRRGAPGRPLPALRRGARDRDEIEEGIHKTT